MLTGKNTLCPEGRISIVLDCGKGGDKLGPSPRSRLWWQSGNFCRCIVEGWDNRDAHYDRPVLFPGSLLCLRYRIVLRPAKRTISWNSHVRRSGEATLTYGCAPPASKPWAWWFMSLSVPPRISQLLRRLSILQCPSDQAIPEFLVILIINTFYLLLKRC